MKSFRVGVVVVALLAATVTGVTAQPASAAATCAKPSGGAHVAPTQTPPLLQKTKQNASYVDAYNTSMAIPYPDICAKYKRTNFGQAWADTNRNGCDTRNDILARDLKNVQFKARTHNCVVLSGVLNDPYTGKVINFVRGASTSTKVQIDHIIPLEYAWYAGAANWSAQQRKEYANDFDVLLAVDGKSNMQKSSSGPSGWMPSNRAYQCEYAKKFIAVSVKYKLYIAEEATALRNALATCN